MIIDFENVKEEICKNFKGGKKQISVHAFADEKNKIMYGKIEPGASIGLHTHETSSEIVYILKGKGKVLYDGEYEQVKQGVCHYCPKGHTHSLINDSDADIVYFAVVPEQ